MKQYKHPFISDYDQKRLVLLKEFIESHPEETLTIRVLSKKAGINRTRLFYCFKKLYGCSIHRFIITTRMEKAKQMLLGSDVPIKAIARDSGYNHVKNFLTAFKKYADETPSAFRRRHPG